MKISESELKQIIVESIEQEGLDESVMDAIRGTFGGVKRAVSGTGKRFKSGKYDTVKASTVKRSLAALEKLKASAADFEESEEFKAALDSAIQNLQSIDVSEPTEPAAAPTGSGDSATARRSAANAAARAARDAARSGAAPATPDAGPDDVDVGTPEAPASEKPKISVFKGKGGQGVQSQMSRAGIKGKDMGRILKGLKSDLSAAGFDVLEEAARREISLEKTLQAIEQIADPEQKKAAKTIIIKLLKKNKVKVADARLKREEVNESVEKSPKGVISEQLVARFAQIAGLTKE